jgi:hypothetical protein
MGRKPWRWPVLALVLAALANVVLLTPTPVLLRTGATLLLTGLLPGALLVELLVGQSKAPPTIGERIVYSVGLGYTSMVTILLALSYLPGGISPWQTLLIYDVLIGLLVLLAILVTPHSPTPTPGRLLAPPLPTRGWLFAALVSLALVGGFFRFANLGYAEFQGDEARLALRAAEVIQGYENALFVHKKGPTEILLPTAVYVLGDRLTEVTARLPFAVANVVGLFALFLLGSRLFGPVAGWAAALLLALDGYLIAFGRVVQYQSVVFLMDVLVVLVFVRLWQRPQELSRYLTLAALLLATGLLSHYEAALVIFPVGYLLWRIWREGTTLATLVRAAAIPVVVGGALLAGFYLPFVLNPAFYDTYYYLTDYRMGGGRLFNHLAEFFARTTVYSSTYYLMTLIVLMLIGLVILYRRSRPRWIGWLLTVGVLIGLATVIFCPAWLRVGETDLTWLFFATALVVAWWMPNFPPSERLVWLWFGAPMILALFFTAIPNTHVYSFFIPWALLVGMVIGKGWSWLRGRVSQRQAQLVALPLAMVAIALFGFYQYRLFVYNRVEVLRTWPEQRPPGYWTVYDEPVEIAIFGFPLNNGWKVVGSLYAGGILEGNYETNARDVVAEWYTRGDHYCARDNLKYFILTNPVEPTLADETAVLRTAVEQEHQLFGTVYVQGNPALSIYERTATDVTPQHFDLAQFESHFDANLATADFERAGPVGNPAIQHPTAYRLGDSIWLRGYRLEQAAARPGDTVEVTFYWEATQSLQQDYQIFVQVIDLATLAKAGQSDGQPGCNRHPTTTWLPGDLIADSYRVTIEPAAPAGLYTLLIGMYTDEGRLEIFSPDGQPLGDQLELAPLTVE